MTDNDQQMTIVSAETLQTHHDLFAELHDNHWRFITMMISNPGMTKGEAAQAIGVTADTVYRYPDVVDEALRIARENIHRAAIAMRQKVLMKALQVKIDLLDSKDEAIRSKAASEIIEWELGKATARTELSAGEGTGIMFVWVDADEKD
jgi:hypothetical protein